MKISGCASCGQLVFFENTACLRCGVPLGFDPGTGKVITLVAEPPGADGGELFRELPPVAVVAAGLGAADSGGAPVHLTEGGRPSEADEMVPADGRTESGEATAAAADLIARDLADAVPPRRRRWYRRCVNAELAACNWLVQAPAPVEGDAGAHPGGLCACCGLTRVRPADTDPVGRERFERAEAAKRRLVAQLLELGLPVVPKSIDPAGGLAFDLLNSTERKVVTGHSDGVITLDLAESDDAHRELVRTQLGEPYRTLLGHFRHEVGHYYWGSLVSADPARSDAFRNLFGDPDIDYSAALDRHYADGPPVDWRETHVSAYATMHPWEDWAETFAHYLHIRDTLRAAAEFGLRVDGPDLDAFGVPAHRHAAEPGRPGGLGGHRDTPSPSAVDIIAQWLPLTYALNAINRSMGREDLYPFVLTPAVQAKLAFVHSMIGTTAIGATAVTAAMVAEPDTGAAASG
ncbi:zinc-binding metallopeptidase family protein [Frankia sp. AgKG'84/4]|uniref:zinc-binding metallopeptidase family protein n=1 Tax=Frankia sp. AgKG'84/4 TaxID=573490 RepID=UPI00200C819A|nr:putative zinc-binding metallopeptidase [Frankia sp. AgKG'84/4]MCL9796766.1 putative zinc-binding peptidase [Frankia sp. AgKG'84/4]